MTQDVDQVLLIGCLMAQELTEFVDDAIEASGDPDSLKATQELIADWERAFAEAGGKTWVQRLQSMPGEADTIQGLDDQDPAHFP